MFSFFEPTNGDIKFETAKIDHDFFADDKACIEEDSILVEVIVPLSSQMGFFRSYKQSKRKENDRAIVNSAFFVDFVEHSNTVKSLWIAYGGVAKTTKLSKCTKSFEGRLWDENLLKDVLFNYAT